MKDIGKSGNEKEARAQQALGVMELMIRELFHTYLPNEEIERATYHSFKKVDEKEEIKEEQKMEVLEMEYNECPICYDSFDGYEVITLTSCGHMFH